MKTHYLATQTSPDDYGVLEAYINKSRNTRSHDARRIQRTLRRFAN